MNGRNGGRRTALFRLSAALLLCAGLWGCAGQKPAPPAPAPPPPPPVAEAKDLLSLPQQVAAYFSAAALDTPLLTRAAQERFYARLRELHFAPWSRTRPAHNRAEALWGLSLLRQNRHYGENLRPLGPAFRAEMEALAQPESYPNTLRPAIATANTSLRVLPTARPGFLKPDRPGEGYPFDYWQNSGLLAGTPILVTHLSRDGAWALVEGRVAGGWVPTADIAYVDRAFMEQWQALPLAAITREGVAIAARFSEDAEGSTHLFDGRIGMLLPLVDLDLGGPTLLAPAREVTGRAGLAAVHLAPGEAEAAPLPPTPRNYARLADQLMGQPYGWGGYLGNRDCSALLLDLYAPFGIFLPRNSSQQARAGRFLPWADLAPADKEAMLLAQGAPLLTLVHKPGHIMLYLGERDGRAVILHDLWGLRTRDESGVEGRFVVGRVAITTLTPGAELPQVARGGLLLPTLDGMTLVAPDK